jgi:hypothetical protein
MKDQGSHGNRTVSLKSTLFKRPDKMKVLVSQPDIFRQFKMNPGIATNYHLLGLALGFGKALASGNVA